MKDLISDKYKIIFWDFDGVLMDSNEIRDIGFRKVLSRFPQNDVDQLIEYHQRNGGLSRYVKFRYFFEEILGDEISEKEVNDWAEKFSNIMIELLINESLLIEETINFVKKECNKIKMHIVSGSDQNELRYICKKLEIDQYFNSINGSPTPKKQLVDNILVANNYNLEECVLVGDSVNDLEAAKINKIDFIGYNYKY